MTQQISNFQLMAKPSGSVCNLNCTYCFYLEKAKLYPARKSQWRMDRDTLYHYIRQTIAAQQGDVVDFLWQGGEPTLLGRDFYREAVRLQQQYSGGKRINNFFQTNGTHLDDRWARFLKQNHFLVGLSIDGDRQSNDAWRLTRAGKSSFDAVMRGLEALHKHQVEFNTLTVVSAQNVQRPLAIYRFLKEIGSRYMQFIPLVEREAAQPDADGLTLISPDFSGQCQVTPWSVPPLSWGRFMNAVFDHWVTHDLGEVFVMNIEQVLAKLDGQLSACVLNETCGANLIVEANGDVYSCDHFVYPHYRLGNLNDSDLRALVNSPRNLAFGQRKKTGMSADCHRCSVLSVCNGGCPKHRFELSGDGKPNKNYFCDGLKLHLQYVTPKLHRLLALLKAGAAPRAIRAEMRALCAPSPPLETLEN